MVRGAPPPGANKTSTNTEPFVRGDAELVMVEALFLAPWPKYIKVDKLVRYGETDLLPYLNACRAEPVAAGGAR